MTLNSHFPYRHSTLVDPATYDSQGLCDGIPLRVHNHQILEDLGCIRAQEDWRRFVAATMGNVKGLLGPDYNIVSTMFPETKPERLEVLAYFNEFVGLHDDVVEEVGKEDGDRQNDEARDVCKDAAATARQKDQHEENQKTGRQRMIASVADRMRALDPESASVALRLWAEWFDQGSGRKFHTRFASLDEYLEYRVLDVGEKLTTGMAIFAMGLSIPAHEFPLLSQLCRPAWVAMGLTNDIFSWDKEKAAADLAGDDHLCNAIWVLMSQHSISQTEAVELCRREIQRHVAEFVDTVSGIWVREGISRDLAVFVETAQFMISGNVVWSQGVPRYNPEAKYNKRQLEWMVHGTPKSVDVDAEGMVVEAQMSEIISRTLGHGLARWVAERFRGWEGAMASLRGLVLYR